MVKIIVNTGLEIDAKILNASDDPPSHICVGTDNTAVTSGDTAQGAENSRKEITTWIKGSTGVITGRTVFSPLEGNCVINEIGVANGDTADATDLYSNSIISPAITKTSAYELRIDVQITKARP